MLRGASLAARRPACRVVLGVRTVILRHTLPDGSWHYDWLVERAGLALVPTWRTGQIRPDDTAMESFEAERIGDHRALYLDYEGEVSGGRGEVERVASGAVIESGWGDGTLVLSADFDGRVVRFVGRSVRADCWRFGVMH